MSFRKTALLITIFLLIAAVAALAQQGPQEILKAQGYLSTDKLQAGSTFRLAVALDVRNGFHANSATSTAGWPAKLTIKPLPGVMFDPPQYPKDVMKAFKFSGGEKLPVYEGHSTVFVTGKVAKNAAIGKRTIVATFSYQACDENTCFPPAEATATIPTEVVSAGVPVSNAHEDIFGSGAKATTVPVNASSTSDPASFFGRGTLVGLLLVFGMGVLLSFTPCVYPMIPVTIGYFGTQTERSTWRLALLAGLYVLGLAAMYSTLGAIAALTGGMFGAALQNPYVPLLIGGVLIALALSMFGVYEFKVPSFVMAKSQGRQGPVGALFMGLLFGVVCAPCVGPFTVALLLYIAKLGKPFFGFLTFFVLSLGLGMPFFFLAFFSSAINRLPQAGMWMVSVRKVFGLLLIGAAIHYVSPLIQSHISGTAADAALPAFIIFSGAYVGWFDSTLGKERRARRIRQAVGMCIVVLGASLIVQSLSRVPSMTFRPYSEIAISQASAQGKPVMIDFTADWCAYCKKLDRSTFPAKEVKSEGERFVRLRADQTERSSADVLARQKKYSISGLPTIVFLDGNGNEVKNARIVGFVNPHELEMKMRSVR